MGLNQLDHNLLNIVVSLISDMRSILNFRSTCKNIYNFRCNIYSCKYFVPNFNIKFLQPVSVKNFVKYVEKYGNSLFRLSWKPFIVKDHFNYMNNLVVLECSDLKSDMPNDVLKTLPQLLLLKCGITNFGKIESKSLEKLYMDKSKISDINMGELPNLNELGCGRSTISDDTIIRYKDKLITLALEYNNTITDRCICELKSLEALDIGYNTNITQKTLNTTNLKVLILSLLPNIEIRLLDIDSLLCLICYNCYLENQTLVNCHNIEELHCCNSMYFNNMGISHLKNLKYLSLGLSIITNFKNNTNLSVLICNNNMERVDISSIKNPLKIKILDISMYEYKLSENMWDSFLNIVKLHINHKANYDTNEIVTKLKSLKHLGVKKNNTYKCINY